MSGEISIYSRGADSHAFREFIAPEMSMIKSDTLHYTVCKEHKAIKCWSVTMLQTYAGVCLLVGR